MYGVQDTSLSGGRRAVARACVEFISAVRMTKMGTMAYGRLHSSRRSLWRGHVEVEEGTWTADCDVQLGRDLE